MVANHAQMYGIKMEACRRKNNDEGKSKKKNVKRR